MSTDFHVSKPTTPENLPQQEFPSYYAVIPAEVRYDKNLEPNAKLLYGEITALCNRSGFCWSGNQYFADLYDVDLRTIKRWLSSLKENNYIWIEHDKTSFNGKRKIYIRPPVQNISTEGQNCHTPVTKMSPPPYMYNNTPNVVGEETPSLIENQKQITKDDLYHYSLAAKKDWKPEEIESAWLAYKEVKIPVTDPHAYIEGIINKKRTLHASKERKETCPKKKFSTSTTKEFSQKSEFSNSKKESSSQDMPEPTLGRFDYHLQSRTS
jgi:hypothetical protein